MKTLLGCLALAIMLCTSTDAVSLEAQKPAADASVTSNADHTITPAAIADAIAKALVAKGAGKEIDVKLFGNDRDAAYAYPAPITLKVENLEFDAKAGTFSAMLNFESEGQALSPSKINGRYDEMVSIPTLKRRLFQGDVIAEEDVIITRVPSSRLRKGTILESASIIGKSPVKVVSANRAILLTDITSVALIHKGDVITLRYTSNNLSINTLGEALDAGVIGDTIRVKNTTSNKVVQATIKSKELAMVQNMIQTDEIRK